MGGLGFDFGLSVFVGVGMGLYVFVAVGVGEEVLVDVGRGVIVDVREGVTVRVEVSTGVHVGLGVNGRTPAAEVVSTNITGNDGTGLSREPPRFKLSKPHPPTSNAMIVIRIAIPPPINHSRRGLLLRSACTASAIKRAVSL